MERDELIQLIRKNHITHTCLVGKEDQLTPEDILKPEYVTQIGILTQSDVSDSEDIEDPEDDGAEELVETDPEGSVDKTTPEEPIEQETDPDETVEQEITPEEPAETPGITMPEQDDVVVDPVDSDMEEEVGKLA